MVLKITACSIIGSRANNEDNLMIGKIKKPHVLKDDLFVFDPKYIELTKQNMSFAVCDGMGGKSNGERMSLTIVKELVKNNNKSIDNSTWKRINEKCIANVPGAGSTCSMVRVRCSKDNIQADYQSVGDSFLYHYNGQKDELKLMTPLDNQAFKYITEGKELEEDELKKAECILLEYIGKKYGDDAVPIHNASNIIESGDKIIIASDGISTLNEEQLKYELFNENFGQNTAFSIACSAINNCGVYPADNTTVIVLEFEN